MTSRSSVRTSSVRLSWLILVLMHAGISANIVDKAFLQLRSREEAWRGDNHDSVMISNVTIQIFLPKTTYVFVLFFILSVSIGPFFYLSSFNMMCCFFSLFCETLVFSLCCCTTVHEVDWYLVLAVGIADAGHVCVGKQEVECDGQEGKVSHEGEVLPVQNHLVQPVGERQPIQSLAHTLQVGVPHTHGQIIIIQTLRRRDGCLT